jgi:uncharacterized membrane protein
MHPPSDWPLERLIGRLIMYGTYASAVLLAIGVILLLAAGRSPLDLAPAFDVAAIPADIAALRPEGFLWLGLIAVIATPATRVAAALLGYARADERGMALVAAAILGVIALSVVVAVGARA